MFRTPHTADAGLLHQEFLVLEQLKQLFSQIWEGEDNWLFTPPRLIAMGINSLEATSGSPVLHKMNHRLVLTYCHKNPISISSQLSNC